VLGQQISQANVCTGAAPADSEESGENEQLESEEVASAPTVCLNNGNNTTDIHGWHFSVKNALKGMKVLLFFLQWQYRTIFSFHNILDVPFFVAIFVTFCGSSIGSTYHNSQARFESGVTIMINGIED